MNVILQDITSGLEAGTRTAEDTDSIRDDTLAKIAKMRKKISRLYNQIGGDASIQNALAVLHSHKEYLTHRTNAMNVLLRIRNKGLARRQEVEQIQRPHMREVNKHKLYREMETHVKKRESSLKSDVSKYNTHCKQLSELIKKGKAPAGAVAPVPLQYEDVLVMDVDSDVWLDMGLSDEDTTDLARWMRDAKVRSGIKWLQQRDRCQEEIRRLMSERRSLHQWFREEWKKHNSALTRAALSGKVTLTFLIERRLRSLRNIFDDWEPTLRNMRLSGTEDELPPWGPEIVVERNWLDTGADDDSEDEIDMDSENEDEGDRIAHLVQTMLSLKNDTENGPSTTTTDASPPLDEGASLCTQHTVDMASTQNRAIGQRPNKRTRVDNDI